MIQQLNTFPTTFDRYAKKTRQPSSSFWPTDRPTVTVVVPAMNEEKNLEYVLPRIPQWVDEVILVDGNSTDNTVSVARELMPDIRVITQTGRGKGVALRDGFSAATCDIIIMIDADGSMAPEEMFSYVSALIAGSDFVKGSRFMQGGGTDDMEYIRYLGNWGLTFMVRTLFGGNYSDLCYGYTAFWRRVLPALNLEADGFEIETEMNVRALKAGLKITEVCSFEAPRIHGTSNLNTWRDGWRVLKKIVREYATKFQKQDTVKVTEDVEMVDPITPEIRLLMREAKHLQFRRGDIDEKSYNHGIQAVKEAAWYLLTTEHEDPEVRQIQEHYLKNMDRMWQYLEPASAKTAVRAG